MRENVGSMDAFVRTLVGGALAYAAVRELERRRLRPAALLALGALLVESAITRVCPVHHLFGLDTRTWPPWRGVRAERRAWGVGAAALESDWGMNAADLELPIDDVAATQRPPDDS